MHSLYHHGVKGMRWGHRKRKTTSISPAVKKRMGGISVSSYKRPNISEKERWHVISELMTHMTRAQREQTVVSKYIGDHLYTFVKLSDGIYEIIHKK